MNQDELHTAMHISRASVRNLQKKEHFQVDAKTGEVYVLKQGYTTILAPNASPFELPSLGLRH